MSTVAPEDRESLLRWLDGELAAGERERFELRLAAEPELARAAEDLAAMDDTLRRSRVRPKRTGAPRLVPLRLLAVPALVAAAVLVLVLARTLQPPAPTPSFRVAVFPVDESARAFLDGLDELRGLRPPGLEELRGQDAEPNVTATDFLARATPALERLAAGSGPAAEGAGFFAVPLVVAPGSPPCEVVLLAVPESGRELRLWPPPDALAPPAPFAAGTHWLPAAPLATGEAGTVRYERGFLVPVGARSLVVLAGVRAAAEGGELERLVRAWDAQLEDVTAGGAAREVERWRAELERAGFAVRELGVREP